MIQSILRLSIYLKLIDKRRELENTPGIVEEALDAGNKRASVIAKNTIEEVRDAIGFIT